MLMKLMMIIMMMKMTMMMIMIMMKCVNFAQVRYVLSMIQRRWYIW